MLELNKGIVGNQTLYILVCLRQSCDMWLTYILCYLDKKGMNYKDGRWVWILAKRSLETGIPWFIECFCKRLVSHIGK